MKKFTFSVFLVSMLAVACNAAFAEDEDVVVDADDSAVLTTKNYVDDGLRYVYNRKADKTSVYTKQEADAKFLTSVDTYTGENGVAVNNNQVGLNVEAQEGSMYVYTAGGWAELEVQDEWSADIFNTPSQDL